jgi:predicted phage terminase large subunit-like protein
MSQKAILNSINQELLRRVEAELTLRRARTSLVDFIRYTKPDYLFGWFNEELCAILDQFTEDLINQKSPRLLIKAPPRHGKSEVASRRFPAYILGRYPWLQVMNASYSAELASAMNRDVQAIMDSPEYNRIFPNTKINGEMAKLLNDKSVKNLKKTADFVETSEHGYLFSGGVGGAFTGFGANCLTGDNLIDTINGKVSIKDISIGSTVICYNEKTHRLEYGKVIAKKVSYASEIYRLCDNQGRSLKSTGEHQIFTGTGYNKANTITKGTDLLCFMRKRTDHDDVRLSESCFKRLFKSVLQQKMCGRKRAYQRHSKAQMSDVWQIVRQRCEVLFRLFEYCTQKVQGWNTAYRENMLNMWQCIFGTSLWTWNFCDLLFQGLQEQSSVKYDEWRRQCKIQELDNYSQRQKQCKKGILPYQTACEEERADVCFMRNFRAFRTPSYRLKPFKQFFRKCCKNLFGMSQRMSQTGDVGDLHASQVQRIERLHFKTLIPVYDIQIEGCNNNYFANGILVHNCFIIDDSIKNREEADSQVMRDKVWDWYTSTAYSRLSEGGGMIIIQTQWSCDDLTGRVIEHMKNGSGDNFTVFEFPAIATKDEKYRKIGEPLHPERFSLAKLEQIRRTVGIRDWSALYQQNPIPDEGGLFKPNWIQYYDELPQHYDKAVMSWDMTFKDTKTSDYVCGQVWVKEKSCYYLVDQIRGRFDFTTTLKKFIEFSNKHPYCKRKLIEDKANGTAVINTLKKHISGIVPITPKESKVARASATSTLWEAHNIYIPDKFKNRWVELEYEDELLKFPGGLHDDQVDCTSQALNDLMSKQEHIDPSNVEAILRGFYG